ncbi:hypothetical protein O6H91_22G004000 [Diphasiastrum complanatum]|uniref:Uncharacterized protein n=1 Tax=Diphasiastrum complanatum TaxID=34168 RepID=A0ACC2AE61_DIPCM|nr:hypothetical protein O6H91_22G004000 [Diphasiastrum complanatum]
MMKTKNWRRRGDGSDGEADDGEKSAVKVTAEKLSKPAVKKEKAKDKAASGKAGGPKLLSFVEDEEDSEGRVDKNWASSRFKKEKQRDFGSAKAASASATLLSFGGTEDDADGMVLHKSKSKLGFGTGHGSGHKVGAGKEKNPGVVATPSNVQPQAGEYTKERLLELQRNTFRLGGAKAAAEIKPTEPVVVLKGLVKPSGALNGGKVKVERLSETDDLPAVPVADVSREKEHRDGSRKEADDTESRLGLLGIGAGAESGGITHIPDATVIAAAKAKRERLRQAQAAPDYIPLSTRDGGDYRGTGRESILRKEQDNELVKEEAESSEDEAEIQGRLAFLGDDGKKSGGVFQSVEEKPSDLRPVGHRDEEEEDEERRWEEEQLRKGVGKRVEETSNRVATASGNTVQGPGNAAYNSSAAIGSGAGSMGWGRPLEALSVAQQADSAMASLHESIQRMQEVHRRTNSDLYRTEENLSASTVAITSFEKNLAASGEKYIFMQRLRDYISVLCDFLQSKGPLIEELEEHMQRLHEERANAIIERRAADEADEMLEVEAAVGAAVAVISKGAGASSAATAAAAASAAAVSAREASTLAPQLDEFGRDVNLQKRLEVRRRAEARQRRMARAAKSRMSASAANGGFVADKVEGESSSDESESEENAYQSGREEVLQTAERIFGDTSEDFSQLAMVKQKLEGWKQQYASAYRDAYMSLSAPAIFAPYVRLELLKWDPLYGDSGFDRMQWYTLLFDYGMPENGKELEQNDADSDLIPSLVEKVALPVLHHEIAHCWDRLSTRGTKNAVAAVQEILLYVPASSDSLQELIGAIRMRLAEAVSAFQVPTWNLQVTNAVGQAARLSAQRFGSSVRLLRNVALWKDILALPVLEQLALEELLLGKILPQLRIILPSLHDAVTRTERVVAALSGVWVGSNFTELSPKLVAFVEYVTILARAAEKKREAGVSSEDIVGLARRIKRMLVDLNEYDRARRLAKNFQLKEAL